MDLKITPSGQTIVKPTALGPGANTDTKLLIYGLFQKGRVLAQDEDLHMVRHDGSEDNTLGCFWPIFFFADYNEAWHTLAGVCIPSLNASLALPV